MPKKFTNSAELILNNVIACVSHKVYVCNTHSATKNPLLLWQTLVLAKQILC